MPEMYDKIERFPANTYPWYWIHAQGKEVWDAWLNATLTTEQEKEILLKIREYCEERYPYEIPSRYKPVDFTKADWRIEHGDELDFSGFRFPDDSSFKEARMPFVILNGATLGDNVSFEWAYLGFGGEFKKTTFGKNTKFDYAFISNRSFFNGATFGDNASFVGARLHSSSQFNKVLFGNDADFTGAIFGETKMAYGSHQGERILFNETTFGENTKFSGAKFLWPTEFNQANFTADVTFDNAKFGNPAIFNRAVFNGKANFTATKFDNLADFSYAKFLSSLPILENIEFKRDVIYESVQWPKPEESYELLQERLTPEEQLERARMAANEQVEYFANLKSQAIKDHRHENEIYFFARELEARANYKKEYEKDNGYARLISLYACFSDYGQSIEKPAKYFLVLSIWMGIIYSLFYNSSPLGDVLRGFHLAIINGVPFIALDKNVMQTLMNGYECWNPIKQLLFSVIRALHWIFSSLFLFLIGLAIRNRLRLK